MSPAFDSVFEFLFKYRPLAFERGQLALTTPWPICLVGLVLLALAVPRWLGYPSLGGRVRAGQRTVLATLRGAVLAVVGFCLCGPALMLSTVVPRQSFLGVLLDDSLSLRIQDANGEPRQGFVERQFDPTRGELLRALEARFKVRLFAFSESAKRVTSAGELGFSGVRTDLAGALRSAHEELSSVPLAGLVLVTDGADNADGAVSDVLGRLGARHIPVSTVGLGETRHSRDLEIRRVEAPDSVLKDSSVPVSVTVAQQGYDGLRVALVVEDGDRIVQSEELDLPPSGESATLRVHLRASEAGPRRFRFSVAVQPGEAVAQNNHREILIEVRDRREKILYIEGEPRFELKFIRRAVADDENLQLVTLIRTARNKLLRLDVDSSEELASGFPRTREELFRYRGVVLGSVEAEFFTPDQLSMLGDFVSQRGGGLLMLGGRHSLSRGGYGATSLAEVLPVVLGPGSAASAAPEGFPELKVELTPHGRTHSALRMASTEEGNLERWERLPPLSVPDGVTDVKPGAATLLLGRGEGRVETQVVLAHQRFGRGRVMVFTPEDSWQWQMHASIGVDDMTHEQLWRQLLRWLVAETPGPVRVVTKGRRVAAGESLTLAAEVEDGRFLPVNDATVVARVKDPSGIQRELRLEWALQRDGEYRGRLRAEEEGLYEVQVEARRGEELLGEDAAHVEVADPAVEFFEAVMHEPLLKRIAEETGGRFYTPATVSSLPEDLSYVGGGETVLEYRTLWDMPAIFLLLLSLLAVEWAYRRGRRLA